MKNFAVVLLAVALISCGEAPKAKKPTKTAELDPVAELVSRAKTTVAEDLKDPQATQFRNVFISDQKSENFDAVVCGEFNSKNGFGAYAGFLPFIYQEKAPGTRMIGELEVTTKRPVGVVWFPQQKAEFTYGGQYIMETCGRLP